MSRVGSRKRERGSAWSQPVEGGPLEEIEYRDATEPPEEPFRTLLGSDDPGPEADYLATRRDPTGAAELWRVAEEHASGAGHRSASSGAPEAIVAAWPASEPIPSFAHRHDGTVHRFVLVDPPTAGRRDPHPDRVVLRCPVCDQVALILREGR